jgi:hypothetical protein
VVGVDQHASGNLPGGVFTNALIGALQKIDKQTSVSTDLLAEEVSAQMALAGNSRQHPKLVTALGADQISLVR